ncbi:MAG: LON peptidase substrate-binding domain-containing protein, partial [Prevotella sp.]|nr:LON peptidase substrate-binding domain-containing protein [Prevotella sp.]
MIADVEANMNDMDHIKVPSSIPILAVRNIVLFPGIITPILVGRSSSIKLVKWAEKNDGIFGVVCQKDPNVDTPIRSDLYDYGVFAKVLKLLTLPNGNITAIVQGIGRIY